MKTLAAIILVGIIVLASGYDGPEEIILQSTIEVLPKSPHGTWIVKDGGCDGKSHLVTVTPETRIEGGGAAHVGDFVEILGRIEGNYLIARKITLNGVVFHRFGKKNVPKVNGEET
jgi:hypothetical protein